MLKSVFVIFLTTCFLQLVAQNNYQPGFVVENNGDTVKGSIDYKRWDRSPTKISFKSVTQSKVYSPLDITSFKVANEIYISAIVDVDRSPHKIAEADNSPNPIYEKDTVFPAMPGAVRSKTCRPKCRFRHDKRRAFRCFSYKVQTGSGM